MTDDLELTFHYSHYAAMWARRAPEWVAKIQQSAAQRPSITAWAEQLHSATVDSVEQELRVLRRELMLRTMLRDITFQAPFSELVSDLTAFADLSVQTALRVHAKAMFGDDHSSATQHLSVVAMGKMGGHELNASSDIDIVFLCDQPRAEMMEPLNRVAQQVIRTLDREINGDFVFRVDTRLRPYGNAGPMVPTLDFLESYFVAQGRLWERVAWLRARICAGSLTNDLETLVKPFVFRRYLDFDAIAGMRELHSQLRAEKTDPRNVKLGRGGIRELEFAIQLRQILRGGREPRVQTRNTFEALDALTQYDHLSQHEARALKAHYEYLRRVEHMLQYRSDLQTQTLPSEASALDALAQVLREASASAFERRLNEVRCEVAAFFDQTLGGAVHGSHATNQTASTPPSTDRYAAFSDPTRVKDFFERSLSGSKVLALPAISQSRLQALADGVLLCAAHTSEPDYAAMRSLDLLLTTASRSSYLALMTERPNVLRRVVDLAATSEWAVRYLATHPLLLDELIDARSLSTDVDYESWQQQLVSQFATIGNDTEAGMNALRHFQQAETFRLLLIDIAGQFDLEALSDHLSALADVCVGATLAHLLRLADLPPIATLAVIAYGKWGSKELGYASDLDLIFLMPDEAIEYRDPLTRVAQKLQSWLTTLTAAGRAYEIDARLRPDGVAGLLLTNRSAFERYQRDKAWVWEHQAITRARFAAGDHTLGEAFEHIRDSILAMPRPWPALRKEVIEMRQRILTEHPNRERDTMFDVKHDPGGLVDMEFAVQALVLKHGAAQPTMRKSHGNIALALRAATLGLLGDNGVNLATHAANAYRELRRTQHATRLRGHDKARVPFMELKNAAQAIQAFYDMALSE